MGQSIGPATSEVGVSKNESQNILFLAYKRVLFSRILEIASLDFANFAYYLRQECHLTDLGG